MRLVGAIEPEAEAQAVRIQVAAADSLYVTDDFLVTHDTLNDSFIILDEAQNTFARADADVPDAARVRLQGGGHG